MYLNQGLGVLDKVMDFSSGEFHFAAPVLRLESGMKMHYLPIPEEMATVLQERKVRRVIGTLNGIPVNRGVMGSKEGDCYLILGRSLLRDIGVILGDTVEAELEEDPNPNQVDIGEEFEAVLEEDEAAADRFYTMTPGKQRSLAHYVTSAKRVETRIKRALELAYKLRTYTLYGDKPKDD